MLTHSQQLYIHIEMIVLLDLSHPYRVNLIYEMIINNHDQYLSASATNLGTGSASPTKPQSLSGL